MSTRASPSVRASRRVADVLYRSLKSALVGLCRARHDAEVTIHRLDSPDDAALRVGVACRGLARMPVEFTVTPAGHSDYAVHCSVEDGPTRRFTYRLSGRGGTTLSRAPALGRELATFLLGELERRIGRRLLQGASGPPRGDDAEPFGGGSTSFSDGAAS